MSLPNLLKAGVLACVGWILLRLAGRVRRLEAVTGAWRVQSPVVPLETWHRELRHDVLTDAEFVAECEREFGGAA